MKKLQPKDTNSLAKDSLNPKATTGTYAAALQDHLIRNSNLKLLNKVSKPTPVKKPSHVQKVFSKGRVICLDHHKALASPEEKIVKNPEEAKGAIGEYEVILKKTE